MADSRVCVTEEFCPHSQTQWFVKVVVFSKLFFVLNNLKIVEKDGCSSKMLSFIIPSLSKSSILQALANHGDGEAR